MKTRDFLAQVAHLVRTEGQYVRRDKAEGVDGTAQTAFWMIEEGERKAEDLPTPEDYQIADDALAYAATIPSTAKSFDRKVQAACSREEIDVRSADFAGAVLDMAIRATEDADFQETYAGSVTSDKPAGFVLCLKGVRIIQKRQITVRGFDRNIVKFATADGDVLTWWASKMPEYPVGTLLARFEGRIKKQFDSEGRELPCVYQGVSETLVKNCVLVPKVA